MYSLYWFHPSCFSLNLALKTATFLSMWKKERTGFKLWMFSFGFQKTETKQTSVFHTLLLSLCSCISCVTCWQWVTLSFRNTKVLHQTTGL